MNRITLFERKDDNIEITIEAYFDERDNLVIDGYDIGKTTKEFWGDADYEYSSTIAPQNVLKLYSILQLAAGERKVLLLALQSRFNTNSCYSEIQKFLDLQGVPYEAFSWR
ncbi:MAG: hypothetical protein ABI477_17360 [Chryseolinea sp.]